MARQFVRFFMVMVLAPHCFASGDNQAWNAVALAGPVEQDSRLQIWFDGHARFRDDGSELGVSIIRPALGWRFSDRWTFWTGYARVTSHLSGPDIEEDRLWQQATFPIARVFGGNLSGRTRLEQRRRNTGDQTGHRLRQFVRWARPVSETKLSVIVWAELFVGLNDTDWGQRSGFDQNRLFTGVGWQFTPKLRLEGGYLNNYLDVGPGPTNHNVSLMLAVSL